MWTDELFIKLDEDTKLLFIYVLTSPHCNMAGYYRLPLLYVSADLGWEIDKVKATLGKLVMQEVVSYDAETSVILVYNFTKYNKLQNANQVKGAITAVLRVPDSSLITTFIECIKIHAPNYTKLFKEGLVKPLAKSTATLNKAESKGLPKRLPKGLPKGLGKPLPKGLLKPLPKGLLNTVNSKQRTVNSIKEIALSELAATKDDEKIEKKKSDKDILLDRFNVFWEHYPKKRSKGQAETTWLKIKPSESLLDEMLAAIALAKNSKSWLDDDGQFVPYPSTWLNAKGWEDEYRPVKKQKSERESFYDDLDLYKLKTEGED